MSKPTADLSDDYETLKADLTKIKSDLATMTSHMVDSGKASASSIKNSVEKNVRGYAGDLQDKAEANPYTFALITMGIGFVVGLTISRR